MRKTVLAFLAIFFLFSCQESNRSTTSRVEEGFDGPLEFEKFHFQIRTPDDAVRPGYQKGYLLKELTKSRAANLRRGRTTSAVVLQWKERGPNNVPGRTRGLLVDPGDPSKNTWLAGSASGGVWKTVNGGLNWTLITPDLPNLATTVLAMSTSNPNIIYLGTGEGFFNLDRVRGNGIFKSTNRGDSWNLVSGTESFGDINRIIIHPTNEQIVVAASSTGMYKTTDGGSSWTKTSSRTNLQDLVADPANFNIQYASQLGVGVLKSTDGGVNWNLSSNGLIPSGRIEIDVSPINSNILYASAEGELTGEGSDLYRSEDGGSTWKLVNVSFNGDPFDFLGDQGWYDNTIACDPFNSSVVYVGGVNLFKVQLTSGAGKVANYSVEQDGTDGFLKLINFMGASNGNFNLGSFAANNSIEIRFGAELSQKAHRFLVPDGATSGVPDANYAYTDYVNVPFEVWDVTRNKQLMVSFRDQDRNGQFNLLPENTSGPALQQAREYLYIQDVPYNSTAPDATITVAGGHEVRKMINLWPVLAGGATWPGSVVTSTLRFSSKEIELLNATTTVMSDAYNQFDGKNRFANYGIDVHPDQHNIVIIPVNASSFRILLANDGGVFLSNVSATPGINQGDWSMRGLTMRTTQFYGADMRPGKEQFIGGTQDNGTWMSSEDGAAGSTSDYTFEIGGDGFEVIWNKGDVRKIIGGSQNNNFRRTTDGGATWTGATQGLSGTHPFISKLAGSSQQPDRIYTLSSDGVFWSSNFGESWNLTRITEKWGSALSLMDVEVSRANADIVWAGSGMSGESRALQVSTDQGLTFKPTTNYDVVTLGNITKLASHPTEPQTAYALFSFSGKPKILRTSNLGQSWTDLSGFGTQTQSSNGFPDVAVYCLFVHKQNPSILWAGTEIGIVESIDNGASWNVLEDFPNVSVWDIKAQDNLLVIATHGRGIWTAAIEPYNQALSFNPPPDVEITQGNINLTANATSGLPVIFTSSDPSRAVVNGNKLQLLSTGPVTITATQPGSALFKEATPLSRTFCITPRRPVITASGPIPAEQVTLTADYSTNLEWSRNGNPISGESGQSLLVTLAGLYRVSYTENGCKSTSEPFNAIVASADNPWLSEIKIYPNPARERINLELPHELVEKGATIEIVSSDGKLIRREQANSPKFSLETDKLVSGVYLLRVRSGKFLLVKRLVVN